MSNLSRVRAAAIAAAGTLTAIALNPVAAFAHEGEPLPLPDGTAPAETVVTNSNNGGTPNLLVAGVIILAALAAGTVIVGKITKSKNPGK
jgi:hypothetical protein